MGAAVIRRIATHLPEAVLDNSSLAEAYPDWSVDKIAAKTGIDQRHIAAEGETSGDLAVAAAEKLFAAGVERSAIDFVLLCTQSPDYFLPTTACLVQDRLGLPTTCGALDFNLGCSGYVYGLGLAKGLIASGQAANVLVITAETYSKFVRNDDRSVRTIFGDGAAATLVSVDGEGGVIGTSHYGTDGRGGSNLIVASGGLRGTGLDDRAPNDTDPEVFMDGPEIFRFTLLTIPKTIRGLLAKAECTQDDIDLFVFHQANAYMLEHLRRKLKIPPERFVVDMAETGNTVSATIPIALERAQNAGRIKPGMKLMLVGFGVGYSWGGCIVDWVG